MKQSIRVALRKALIASRNFRSQISFGNSLIFLVVVLNVWLIFSAILLTHYFGFDVLSSVLYIPNEACPPGYESFGNHCFGDYSWVEFRNFEANPWGNLDWLYFGGAMLPSLVFQLLGRVLGSTTIGMNAYLVFMMAAMSLPAIWASRGRPAWLKAIVISLFGFLSIPALWAFDRGNVVGWSVLGIFVSVYAFTLPDSRRNNWIAIVGLVIATFVKPQLGLGILAFLIVRRYRWFFVAGGVVALANIAAFLVWPRDFPATLWQAIKGATAWSDQLDATQMSSPLIVSFPKGAYLIADWIRDVPGLGGLRLHIQGHQMLVSIFCIVIIGISLFLARRILSPALIAAFLFLTGALSIPVSFAYYLVAVLPIAAIVLRDSAKPLRTDSTWFGELDRSPSLKWSLFLSKGFLVLTLGLSVSRLLLWVPGVSFFPLTEYPQSGLIHTSGSILGIAWFASICFYALAEAWAARTPSENSKLQT